MSSKKSPVQKYKDIDVLYHYKNLETKKARKIYKILYSWKNNLHPQYYATMNYKLVTDFIILYKFYYHKKIVIYNIKKIYLMNSLMVFYHFILMLVKKN